MAASNSVDYLTAVAAALRARGIDARLLDDDGRLDLGIAITMPGDDAYEAGMIEAWFNTEEPETEPWQASVCPAGTHGQDGVDAVYSTGQYDPDLRMARNPTALQIAAWTAPIALGWYAHNGAYGPFAPLDGPVPVLTPEEE